MARSISVVEYKVQQAHFFLQRITDAGSDLFAVQCYTDAFASAARSVTFSMQAVIKEIHGFEPWYMRRVELLKEDRIARFFNDYRVASTHIGDTVVRGASSSRAADGTLTVLYSFIPISDLPSVPHGDVYSICKGHFTKILGIVFDAFTEFLWQLDDRWYYTAEHFVEMGKTVEDAVQELGFPAHWLGASRVPEEEQWRLLRRTQTTGCQVNDLFQIYLGKTIRGPDEQGYDSRQAPPAP